MSNLVALESEFGTSNEGSTFWPAHQESHWPCWFARELHLFVVMERSTLGFGTYLRVHFMTSQPRADLLSGECVPRATVSGGGHSVCFRACLHGGELRPSPREIHGVLSHVLR